MLSSKIFDLQDSLTQNTQDDKNSFIFGSQKNLGSNLIDSSVQGNINAGSIGVIGSGKKLFKIPTVQTPNVNTNIGQDLTNTVQQITQPSINTPSITTPNVETNGVQVPNVNTNIQSPSIDVPKVDIPNVDTTNINLGNPNLPPALDFNFEDIKMPEVQNGVKLPDLSEVANTIKSNLGMDIQTPSIETPKINNELLDHIGDAVKPIADVINAVSKPVQEEINTQLNNVKNVLGAGDDLLKDSSIRQGDGKGYGEVKLADGVVLDVSKSVDNAFSTVSQGTPLEGVSGSDVYNLATNPTSFIEDKGHDVATSILTNNMGMDKSVAGDVVQAISDPKKFVEQKGVEAVSNMIGVDSGLVNALTSGDIGKAAEGIAKNVVSNVVVDTISTAANAIIPGSGVVLKVLAEVFHYSCYLSTSAYYNQYITREDYLDFTKYRIAIQSKSFLSNYLWAGYICGFEGIYSKMLFSKNFAYFIFRFVTKPFMIHVKWKLGKGKLSIVSEVITFILWMYCLVNYLIHYKKASRILRNIDSTSTINVYKKVLRII